MIFINWHESGPTPGILKKEWRKMLAAAYLRMGKWWHERIRPKHFTRAGARSYGYPPLTPKYERYKQKRFGHKDPLVFTGMSRASTAVQDVRATSKSARVVMRAPALNWIAGGRVRDMPLYARLTKVTQAEADELGKIAALAIEWEARLLRHSKRERIS